MSQNVSSAAVLIGVLRVKHIFADITEDFQLTNKDSGPRLEQSVLGPNFCNSAEKHLLTLDRRQSKMLILLTNIDKKSLETEFSIVICRPTGHKWQS